LAQAIITALPSHHFFSIEIDGRLIVDGGGTNIPIDEVKVGADIIIGRCSRRFTQKEIP
jgi:hypothetical protein